MRSGAGVIAALSLFGFGADSVNFDSVRPGEVPPNWKFANARPADKVRWEVRFDPTAPSRGNVLENVSGSPREYDFSVAVFDKVDCRDGDLSVKFKIDGGRATRTAGIVWRYQDQNNYYLLHFSADEKNVVLFRVQNGKARVIPIEGAEPGRFGIAHDIRVGQWYVAKVIFRGSKFRVLFGNRRLFEADDPGISTAGKTGVWTRGHTTASFDDFRLDKKG